MTPAHKKFKILNNLRHCCNKNLDNWQYIQSCAEKHLWLFSDNIFKMISSISLT